MEVKKQINADEQSIRFAKSFSAGDKLRFLISFLVSAIGIAVFSVLTFALKGNGAPLALYIVFVSLFAAVMIFVVSYLIFRKSCPYDVLIDSETIYLRDGSQYMCYNRYELGTVEYSTPHKKSIVQGPGDKSFLISPGRITFFEGAKKVTKRVFMTDKLAYILMMIAENPSSGVNWGTAYDSLPGSKG